MKRKKWMRKREREKEKIYQKQETRRCIQPLNGCMFGPHIHICTVHNAHTVPQSTLTTGRCNTIKGVLNIACSQFST